MKRLLTFTLIFLLFVLPLTACREETELQDGYYTAQAKDFSHGWKEYITIMVKGGSIVSVEYNAENASGFIKSWDSAYMQTMLHSNGTYPNEYTRYYAAELIEKQNSSDLDALTGATTSGNNFMRLTAAVIEQAIAGDPDTRIVEME